MINYGLIEYQHRGRSPLWHRLVNC